jgi:ribosome-associated toxin RatA of RatAB toxin-antitoxin module
LELRRSVLVPYSAEGMFDLIEHAEDYPQFLPWCIGATILERSDDWVAARIEFSYLRVRFGFQTRNPKRRPEWLSVRLVEGPFRHFQADWHLRPLGHQGCKISFDLCYEVSDGVLDRVAARAVDVVSRSMMDAFIQRAEATLGATPAQAPTAWPRAPAAAHDNAVAAMPAVAAEGNKSTTAGLITESSVPLPPPGPATHLDGSALPPVAPAHRPDRAATADPVPFPSPPQDTP